MLARLLSIARRCTLALALAVAAAGVASPSAAVCTRVIGDPVWVPDPNGSVFIGTAVETRATGQNALFHVEEVWMGAPLPEWQVAIGTDSEASAWEDQPQFTVGTRYLVVARWSGSTLRPVGCGGTQPYSADLVSLRPTDAAAPVPASRPAAWQWGPPWVLPVPVVILAMTGLLAASIVVWGGRPAPLPALR